MPMTHLHIWEAGVKESVFLSWGLGAKVEASEKAPVPGCQRVGSISISYLSFPWILAFLMKMARSDNGS